MKKIKIVFYLLLVALVTFIICYSLIAFCTMEINLKNWHVALRIMTTLIVVGVTIGYSLYISADDCN